MAEEIARLHDLGSAGEHPRYCLATHKDRAEVVDVEIPEDLDSWEFADIGLELTIYNFKRAGARRILLLHELPGLSEDCVAFGRKLYERGFDVHMPLLFGRFGQSSVAKGSYQMWCLRNQFELFRNNRSSPIADRLWILCDQLATESGTIGVVGMCATGGIVMSLLYSSSVGAAVTAQPAMPLRLVHTRKTEGGLGASRADVQASVASGKPLMGLRFTWDPLCPANRLRQLRETFGEHYEEYIAAGNVLRHSTLTQHAADAGDAVDNTIEFLISNLSS